MLAVGSCTDAQAIFGLRTSTFLTRKESKPTLGQMAKKWLDRDPTLPLPCPSTSTLNMKVFASRQPKKFWSRMTGNFIECVSIFLRILLIVIGLIVFLCFSLMFFAFFIDFSPIFVVFFSLFFFEFIVCG